MTIKCRKCGWPIMSGEYRFGSPKTGWEHMEGECLSPPITEDAEIPPTQPDALQEWN